MTPEDVTMKDMPPGYKFQETHAIHTCECQDCMMFRYISDRIRAAVLAERERCAKMIQSYPSCGCTGFCECYGRYSFGKLAASIRAGED